MNLAAMIALVRQDLHDEDHQNYRWTDTVLTRHIGQAVKEFSRALPRQTGAALATTNGSREVSLASLNGLVMVEAVEYPVGRYPPCYSRFTLWGNTLTLLGENIPDGSNCKIYYGELHSLGASSTIPAAYENLIAAGACGYAAMEWAVYAINRVNAGGTGTAGELASWGKEKLGLFRADLKRLGRRAKVRINSLYTPFYPMQFRTTDPGPGS